jgi:hypothetical protein
MFANTLTLTVNVVAFTLLRINQDNYGSEYLFKDSVQKYSLKIRHSTDNQNGFLQNRHNVYLEHVVYATPTVSEKFFSATVTLRDREGSGPADLLKDWQGFNTLLLTLDDTLVSGDN